jgi:acetyltransferase-like isoleucine patch superfamily enzyme
MLIKLLNKIISRLKGSEYSLNPGIPVSYLTSLLLRRLIMLIRGKLSFIKNRGMLFIGTGVVLRARSMMQFGSGITLDDSTLIDALSTEGVIFGNNVSTGKRTVIECSGSLKFLGKGIKIGDNVGLGRDCFYGCAGGIEIGSNTIVGNFASFHSENHVYSDPSTPIRLQGVTHKGIIIGENCWIGAKVTILDGVNLPSGCIIAAGAVLRPGLYESNHIYGGVPAKLVGKRY